MDADGNGTVDFEEFLRYVGNKFEQTRTVSVDSVDQSAQQQPDPVEDEANKLVFNTFDKEETFFGKKHSTIPVLKPVLRFRCESLRLRTSPAR